MIIACFIMFCLSSVFLQVVMEEEFYAKESDASEDDNEAPKKQMYIMDPDHRLLLRTCKPLLQSRNAAVSKEIALSS